MNNGLRTHRQNHTSAPWFACARFLCVMYFLIGCRDHVAPGSANGLLDYVMDNTVDPVRLRNGAICDSTFKIELKASFRIEECTQTVADSLLYGYDAPSGANLVHGKVIHVDALRLKPYADSIKSTFSSRLGRGVNCLTSSDEEPFTYYFRYWRYNGRTVFVRATILESPPLFPALTIEIDQGAKSCSEFVGFPSRR